MLHGMIFKALTQPKCKHSLGTYYPFWKNRQTPSQKSCGTSQPPSAASGCSTTYVFLLQEDVLQISARQFFQGQYLVVLLTAMFFTRSLCFPSVDALPSLQMESMSYIAFISLGQTNQDLFYLLMTRPSYQPCTAPDPISAVSS